MQALLIALAILVLATVGCGGLEFQAAGLFPQVDEGGDTLPGSDGGRAPQVSSDGSAASDVPVGSTDAKTQPDGEGSKKKDAGGPEVAVEAGQDAAATIDAQEEPTCTPIDGATACLELEDRICTKIATCCQASGETLGNCAWTPSECHEHVRFSFTNACPQTICAEERSQCFAGIDAQSCHVMTGGSFQTPGICKDML